MNDVSCPRCAGTNPSDSAFCGKCGAPLAAQLSGAPAGSSSPGGQQPVANQPPPPNPYPPPQNAYPPPVPGTKVLGNNTKWALGLGIASVFCCGPVTGVIGIFLAKKDMDEIAAGRAPQLDESMAKVAFYLNIIASALAVVGLCLFWGMAAMRRL